MKVRPQIILPRETMPLNIMRPDADAQAPLPLVEVPGPPRDVLAAMAGGATYYRLGECSVIVTRESGLWHLSIAHQARYPTWDEISQARYRILPDEVTMAMLLPPRSQYVNIHRNCFQLHEIRESDHATGT